MDRRTFLSLSLTTAAPYALGWPSPSPRRPSPVALVTADTEAHVVVVSLTSGRVRARVATLPAPRSIESAPGGLAVIAHTTEGALTILERGGLDVRAVVRDLREPRYTAIAPDGRHAYVTDSARGEIVVIDLARGRVVARERVGARARHLSLDPAGRTLWVALGTRAAAIAVVDVSSPRRPRTRGRIRPPFLAHDVGFSPGGRRVWVTSGDRGRLAVYDTRRGEVVRLLDADAPPQHVTFGDGLAYVASGDSAALRVHSLRDGAVRRTSAIPIGSYNVQFAAARVLTPSLEHGTLTVLSPAGTVLRRVRVAAAAHDACVAG